MSNDERPDSLAAQAASWVPPWERAPREPDRAYQAAAEAAHAEEVAREEDDEPEKADTPLPASHEPVAVLEPGDEDEFGSVDSPHGDAPVGEPTEVHTGPELPVPDAIEQAAEAPEADEVGTPVDAPLPDGDDAGDVFDAAADDDVSDDAEVDLPFAEEVPTEDPVEDETAGGTEQDAAEDHGQQPRATPAAVTAEETPAVLPAVSAEDERADRAAEDGHADRATEDARANRAAVPAQPRAETTIDDALIAAPHTDDDLPGLTDDADFAAALEAIMLVVDEPVAEMQLAQILEQPTERVAATLDNLSARYTAAGHGFDLRRAAGGWRLYTRPEYAAYVERFVLDGQSVRLTQAALETLAVVAYKQPVTRSRISAIRGVNCDGVMRTLVTRGLIEECGTEGETGAYLYRTTALFLEKLGLNSVDQLPPLAPFLPDDVEEVLDASG